MYVYIFFFFKLLPKLTTHNSNHVQVRWSPTFEILNDNSHFLLQIHIVREKMLLLYVFFFKLIIVDGSAIQQNSIKYILLFFPLPTMFYHLKIWFYKVFIIKVTNFCCNCVKQKLSETFLFFKWQSDFYIFAIKTNRNISFLFVYFIQSINSIH